MDTIKFLRENMMRDIKAQGMTEINALRGVDYAMLQWSKLSGSRNAYRDMVNAAGGRAASAQGKKWRMIK